MRPLAVTLPTTTTTFWLLVAQEEGLGSKISRSLLATSHRQQEGRAGICVRVCLVVRKVVLLMGPLARQDSVDPWFVRLIRIETATRKFLASGTQLPAWTSHLAILTDDMLPGRTS